MKKIISAILALSMLFVFIGCRNSDDNPSAAIERFLSAVKNNDEAIINEYIDYNKFINKDIFDKKEDGDLYYSLLTGATENLEYTIEEEKIEDDIATVTLKVKNLNMANIIPDAICNVLATNDTPSRDDIQTALNNYMDIAKGKTNVSVELSKSNTKETEKLELPTDALDNSTYEYTAEIEITLKKIDNSWEIKVGKDLFDQLTGNYISAVKSLTDIKMSK